MFIISQDCQVNPDILLDCSSSSSVTPIPWRNSWFEDPKRNFFFCVPPKTSCTSVNFIFQAIEQNDTKFLEKETYYNLKDTNSIYKKMKRYRPQDSLIPKKKDYRYALNVRHPFEKIYSAWKDKMNTKKVYHTQGPYIQQAENARKFETINDKYKPEGYACSFESFLEWIADSPNRIGFDHYMPITTTCSLCEIDFTDITQQESLTDDVLEFFKTVGSDEEAKFLSKVELQNFYALKKYPTSAKASEVFTEISKTRKDLVMQIYQVFYWDFQLLGYTLNGYLSI